MTKIEGPFQVKRDSKRHGSRLDPETEKKVAI